MQIQAILIPRSHYTKAAAKHWMTLHNHPFLKIHTTKDYYRFRIAEPIKKHKYKTIELPNSNGIKMILFWNREAMELSCQISRGLYLFTQAGEHHITQLSKVAHVGPAR